MSKLSDHFQTENHGSVWLIRPLTDSAHEWLQATAPEDANFLGSALVVEPRYVMDVMDAAEEAGFADLYGCYETPSPSQEASQGTDFVSDNPIDQ